MKIFRKIRFPNRCSHNKHLYTSLLSCDADLGFPITNHHPGQLATALNLSLTAVRYGVPIGFAHQVQITLYDKLFMCKKHCAR